MQLANIIYDNEDLEEIRREAYGETTCHNLSGFVINAPNSSFDLSRLYDSIRTQALHDQNVILTSLTKDTDATKTTYKGQYEYTRKKAGRIEFLKDDISSFEFYFIQTSKKVWQVEIDGNKSTDTKELYNLLSQQLPEEGFSKETIDEVLFNDKQSILFFDELARSGLSNDWTFQQVDHLTVKRGSKVIVIEEEEEDHENGNILDLEQDDNANPGEEDNAFFDAGQLSGISSAILQGKDLRDDDFVKSCEEKGYRFSAMTYQFEHTKRPLYISIKAEFKGRPKVFEVSITQIQEKTGFEGVRKTGFLTSKENREIRSYFWNNARKLFKKVQKGGI